MEHPSAQHSPGLGPALLVSALLHALALGGLALWSGQREAARLAGSTTLSISLVDSEEAHKAAEPRPRLPTPAPGLAAPLPQAPEAIKEGQDLEDSLASAAAASLATSAVPAPREASFNADYLHNPKPRYPALSRRLGEQGRVLLQVQVSVEGKALEVTVKESSGFHRLDEAAMEVVKQWQFIPARQGDTALASQVDVPIQFSLEK